MKYALKKLDDTKFKSHEVGHIECDFYQSNTCYTYITGWDFVHSSEGYFGNYFPYFFNKRFIWRRIAIDQCRVVVRLEAVVVVPHRVTVVPVHALEAAARDHVHAHKWGILRNLILEKATFSGRIGDIFGSAYYKHSSVHKLFSGSRYYFFILIWQDLPIALYFHKKYMHFLFTTFMN